MSYIRFENIVKSFGSNTVLKDINLEVEKGQLVTLLGPSGCGRRAGGDGFVRKLEEYIASMSVRS